ncbi:hypothetical protein ACVIGB_000665 [Bradyrhizobium sp. USDA 4341]
MSATKAAPELKALFEPQEWIRDNAEYSGPAVQFDAGPVLLGMSAADFRKFDLEIRRDGGS